MLLFTWWFLIILALTSETQNLESSKMDVIHRELASVNPAWHRVLTFILNSNQVNNGNKDRGQVNDDGECCLTDHSGWWCRRRRRYEGHLHPLGDNQLGHRSERPVELYETTDWSCRDETAKTQVANSSLMSTRHYVDAPAVFSILMNFGRNKYYQFLLSMLDYLEQDHGCRLGYVWDPFASACRRIYCGPDEKDDNILKDLCHNEANENDTDWRMTYVMKLDAIQLTLYADAFYDDTSISDESLLAVIQESFASAFASFVAIDPLRITNLGARFFDQSITNETSTQSVAIDFWLSQAAEGSGELDIDSVVALMGSLIVQDRLIVVMNGTVAVQLIGIHEQPVPSETDSFANWCRGGTTAVYHNDEFILDVNNNTETGQTELIVYIKATDTWYNNSGEYMADLFFYGSSDSATSLSGSVVVCEDRSVLLDTSCSVIHLNESEFIFLDDNSTVLYNGSIPLISPVLEKGEYESLPDGGLAVCLEMEEPYWPKGLIVEYYLILILMPISIVALSATLLTYILFSELRNLAGLAVMNLCITTAVFQMCLMIGAFIDPKEKAQLCIAAAIIIHYEGLASFLWTNVMAADLYLTLGRWSAAPRSQKKIFPRYALYAYGLPCLIVSVSVAINFCGCTGDFTPDYGILFCWISNPKANIVFFILPLVLALLANVILFLRTMAIIHRSSAGNPTNCKEKALGQLKLYARMSTVMGFVWIFALIAAFFDPISPAGLVFTFIYIILIAMAGLSIFVAFTCNRRVYQLYREWWASRRRQLRRSSTTTDSVSSSNSSRTKPTQRRPQMKTVSVETLVSNSEGDAGQASSANLQHQM